MIYMDTGMIKWIERIVSMNLWRLSAWYSREELIADANLCYAKCRFKYKQFPDKDPTKEQRKHFMALFQRAFLNHINSLAKRKKVEEHTEELSNWDKNLVCWQDTFLKTLVTQLPKEFVEVLVVLANDSISYSRTRVEMVGERVRLRKTALRETSQEHIARLLNGDPEVDYVCGFSKYLLN